MLGEKFDRVFLDIIMLGGAAIILAWIIFDYTILSFFSCLSNSCKSDL
jgi:hypothetical protein